MTDATLVVHAPRSHLPNCIHNLHSITIMQVEYYTNSYEAPKFLASACAAEIPKVHFPRLFIQT